MVHVGIAMHEQLRRGTSRLWESARPWQGKLRLRETSHGTLHIAADKSWKSVKWPLSTEALTCVLISATDPRRIPRNVEQPC